MADGAPHQGYKHFERVFSVPGLRRSSPAIRLHYARLELSASAVVLCSNGLGSDVADLVDACRGAKIDPLVCDADVDGDISRLTTALPAADMAIFLVDRAFLGALYCQSQLIWARKYNRDIRLTWICRDIPVSDPVLEAHIRLGMPWPLDLGDWDDVGDFLRLEVMEAKGGGLPRGYG
ncbi:MAG: hypothetical protein JNM59_11375 [Hyphomonadaceae bacterium]|nr:hypothetical protein [Hyphomonadaceae bacterium]